MKKFINYTLVFVMLIVSCFSLSACKTDSGTFIISAKVYYAKYGYVSGGGEIEQGKETTIKAIALYEENPFIGWFFDGKIVSFENNYTIIAEKETQGTYIAVFDTTNQDFLFLKESNMQLLNKIDDENATINKPNIEIDNPNSPYDNEESIRNTILDIHCTLEIGNDYDRTYEAYPKAQLKEDALVVSNLVEPMSLVLNKLLPFIVYYKIELQLVSENYNSEQSENELTTITQTGYITTTFNALNNNNFYIGILNQDEEEITYATFDFLFEEIYKLDEAPEIDDDPTIDFSKPSTNEDNDSDWNDDMYTIVGGTSDDDNNWIDVGDVLPDQGFGPIMGS